MGSNWNIWQVPQNCTCFHFSLFIMLSELRIFSSHGILCIISYSQIIFSRNLLALFPLLFCGVKLICLVPLLIKYSFWGLCTVVHFSLPVSCMGSPMDIVATSFQNMKAEVFKGLVCRMVLLTPTWHWVQCFHCCCCCCIASHIQ